MAYPRLGPRPIDPDDLGRRPTLARDLTLARIAAGLTIPEAAALIKRSHSLVHMYETGKAVPKPARVRQMLDAYRAAQR